MTTLFLLPLGIPVRLNDREAFSILQCVRAWLVPPDVHAGTGLPKLLVDACIAKSSSWPLIGLERAQKKRARAKCEP